MSKKKDMDRETEALSPMSINTLYKGSHLTYMNVIGCIYFLFFICTKLRCQSLIEGHKMMSLCHNPIEAALNVKTKHNNEYLYKKDYNLIHFISAI
jgi:hypothetical protein